MNTFPAKRVTAATTAFVKSNFLGLSIRECRGRTFVPPTTLENRLRLFAVAALWVSMTSGQAQSTYEPYLFTTFAGDAGYGSADGTGSAAHFYYPFSLALDPDGNMLVADTANDLIRKVTPAGVATTFASGLSGPDALSFDSTGNLYVANNTGDTVSKVTPAGVVSTFLPNLNAQGQAPRDRVFHIFSGKPILAAAACRGTVSMLASTLSKVSP